MPRYFKANNFNDRWKNDDPEKAIEEYKNIWKLAPNYSSQIPCWTCLYEIVELFQQ
jgi:hypothetical protein